TLDFTSRLNGATNGSPQLNTAPVFNGAIYTNDIDIADIGSGSGVLQSFVRVQSNTPTEQGYNTSGRPLQFDENNTLSFTHNLLTATIPIEYFDVNGDGHIDTTTEAFREFRLDINENNNDVDRWLSLDRIQVWQSDTGSLNTGFVPAGAEAGQTSYAGGGNGLTPPAPQFLLLQFGSRHTRPLVPPALPL